MTNRTNPMIRHLLSLTFALTATLVVAPEDEVIREKVQGLQDKSQSVTERMRLAAELGVYGPKGKAAVPALIEALADEYPVRKKAIQSLANIKEPTVPALIDALDPNNLSILLGAIEALREIGPAAAPANPRLLKALAAAEDGEVRVAVVRALGAIAEPASVPALAGRVRDDPDFGVRRCAAYALSDLGPKAKEAVPHLIDALRQTTTLARKPDHADVPDSAHALCGSFYIADPVISLRIAAMSALAAVGEPAIPVVVELLRDKDNDLKVRALDTLRYMGAGAKTAVPAIANCLGDEEPKVREAATDALADLGPDAADALPALRKVFRDSVPRVRISAAYAALKISPEAEEALDVLREGLRHSEARVRLLAVQGLGALRLTARPALEALVEAAKDPDDKVREWAVIWLGETGRPAEIIVPALEAALKDRTDEVRYQAVRCLGEVKGGEKAVPSLIRVLEDPGPGIRRMAAMVLRRYAAHAGDAVPALERALKDPDEDVRKEAAEALIWIKEQKKEK